MLSEVEADADKTKTGMNPIHPGFFLSDEENIYDPT
jgi:hypothetical protein